METYTANSLAFNTNCRFNINVSVDKDLGAVKVLHSTSLGLPSCAGLVVYKPSFLAQ